MCCSWSSDEPVGFVGLNVCSAALVLMSGELTSNPMMLSEKRQVSLITEMLLSQKSLLKRQAESRHCLVLSSGLLGSFMLESGLCRHFPGLSS